MRTLTQRAAMVFGVAFVLFAVLGFLLPGGMGMESDPEAAPDLLGLFPVNLLHNLVHLAFGVWGLLAARTLSAAKGYHRGAAVIYIVLAILGFVAPTGFGMVPLGGLDPALHIFLAAGLGYFGFVHREAGVRV